MVVARTSSAPRKMNGNPRTLFTWFGIIGAARGDDRVRPGRHRHFVGDLGIGIRQRENDRVGRHRLTISGVTQFADR